MRRLNARFFVSMGLVSLLASVMLLAMYLGYIPDPHATIRQGRRGARRDTRGEYFDVDQPVQRQECRGGAGVYREAQCGPAVGGGRQGGRRDGRGHRRPSAELAGARGRGLHGRPDPGPDSRGRREVGAAGTALPAPGPARRHGLRARATDSDGGLRRAGEPAVASTSISGGCCASSIRRGRFRDACAPRWTRWPRVCWWSIPRATSCWRTRPSPAWSGRTPRR